MAGKDDKNGADLGGLMIRYWNHLDGHPGGSDAETLMHTAALTPAQRRELDQGIRDMDLIHEFIVPLRDALNAGDGQGPPMANA